MRISRIDYDDILNGPGRRVVLWVQGCTHKCYNCQNPHTWNELGGREFTANDLNKIIDYLRDKHVTGITISGGDPFHIVNRQDVLELCERIKKETGKSIWVYTGYKIEELRKNLSIEQMKLFVSFVDVLVDGKYVDSLKIDGDYKGSSNQRIIDVKETGTSNTVILWEDKF